MKKIYLGTHAAQCNRCVNLLPPGLVHGLRTFQDKCTLLICLVLPSIKKVLHMFASPVLSGAPVNLIVVKSTIKLISIANPQ